MGSMPLPALNIRPPADPMEQYAKAMQIRSLLLGQKLGAAELQGKNLDNQEKQLQLNAQAQVVAAQHDSDWNPNDPDAVVRVLKKYNVPIQAQANVMKGIGEMQSGLMNVSKENLAMRQQLHEYFDQQFQGAKAAPPDRQQSAYKEARENVQNYISGLPNGPGKAMALQEIAKAPPLFDEQWINTEHALLRTGKDINEEALRKAQTREAAGRGYQAEQEGNLVSAKIPGAQAQSTIEQQNAAQGPQGRALAGNLFFGAAGGNAQAGRALQLETQQKAAAAAAGGKASARSDKSFQYNNGELDKVGKPIEDALARFGRLQATIQQNTPQADALVAPELLTVMAGGAGSGLRMNEAEISRIVGGRSKWETLKAAVNKWSLDPKEALSITPEQRSEIRSLMDEVHGRLLKKQAILDKSRDDLINTDDPTDHRKIVAGARSSLTKLDSGEAQNSAANTLPRGAGKVIDKATAKQFYDAAGGDPDKARKMAADAGWKVQ